MAKVIREENMNNEKKKSKNGLIVLWIALMVIVIIIIMLLQACPKKKEATVATVGGYTQSDIDKLTARQASAVGTTFAGRSEYAIPADGYIPFQNVDKAFSIKYTVKDAEGTVVFESEPIAPEKEARWYLDNKLTKGEYTMTLDQVRVDIAGNTGNGTNSLFTLTVY